MSFRFASPLEDTPPAQPAGSYSFQGEAVSAGGCWQMAARRRRRGVYLPACLPACLPTYHLYLQVGDLMYTPT